MAYDPPMRARQLLLTICCLAFVATTGSAQNPAQITKQAESLVRQGDIYRDTKDWPRAIDAYQRARALEPSFGAFAGLGLAYDEQKDYRNSVDAWKRALAIKPDATAANRLGLAHYYLDEPQAAVAAFQQAIQLKSDSPSYNYNLGLVYLDLKDYPNAANAFKNSIALTPTAAALNNLGFAYHQLQRYPEAIAQYQEAIRLDSKSVDNYYGLGMSYLHSGNKDKALETQKTLQSLNPAMARKLLDEIQQP